MSTFAVTDQSQVIDAVNYAISNLGSQTSTLANSALVVNASTNAVTVGSSANIYSYNVQYINIRYANNAVGSDGFTSAPTNSFFYGIQATNDEVPATIDNAASYSWKQVAGNGFSTTNFLFYACPGGRQITFNIANAAPNGGYQQTQNGIAINLDLVTTIAANAVTPNTIANGTITGSQIAANTITGYNIQTNTITATNIAPSTITGSKIAANTITNTNIANFTIVAGKIANATITTTQIAANTILGTNIANGTITGGKVGTNTITGTNIGTQTITANNIANNTITSQQLANTISVTGNITASYFIGNGSHLTGINGSNIVGGYGNANVAAYLPTYSGTILVDQVNFTNNSGVIEQGADRITITGNAIQVNTGGYFNDQGEATIFANSYVVIATNSNGNVNPAWTFDQLGELSAPGNISAVGQIISNNFIVNPVALANLTAISGARAFVNNANLIAANNFGQQISGGGSNIVPVWSNGINWFIG